MERYPKLFIKISLIYLLFGVGLGFYISLEKAFNFAHYSWALRFAHIHLNLIGFVGMMIFGVAYHILPRFNAKPLRFPDLVPVHFYLTNIGLIGMAGFNTLGILFPDLIFFQWFFALFATILAGAIFIFVINLFPVLDEAEAEVKDEMKIITGEMKVTDVLNKYPQALEIFVRQGFSALANPIARASVAKFVTIGRACKIHHKDLDAFLEVLNVGIKIPEEKKEVSKPTANAEQFKKIVENPANNLAKVIGKKTGAIQRGERCSKDVLIGELLKVYPETKPVFEKYYGGACFNCPGQAYETVDQTASMHGISMEQVLGEINQIIDDVLAGKK